MSSGYKYENWDESETEGEQEDEEGEYEEEEETHQPTQEELEYLALRARLKESIRRKIKKESGTANSSSRDKVKAARTDSYGSFFGPSQPVIAQRVIQESKSLLENPHLAARISKSNHVHNKTHKSSVSTSAGSQPRPNLPKATSGLKKKVEMLKNTRDYSFLLSEDAEPPTLMESPPSRNVSAPKSEARSAPLRSNGERVSDRRRDVSNGRDGRKQVSESNQSRSKVVSERITPAGKSLIESRKQLGSNSASGPGRPVRPNVSASARPTGYSASGPGRPSGPSTSGQGRPSGPSTSGQGRPSGPSTSGQGRPSGPSTSGQGRPSGPSTSGQGRPSGPSTSGPGRPIGPKSMPSKTPVPPTVRKVSQPFAKQSATVVQKSTSSQHSSIVNRSTSSLPQASVRKPIPSHQQNGARRPTPPHSQPHLSKTSAHRREYQETSKRQVMPKHGLVSSRDEVRRRPIESRGGLADKRTKGKPGKRPFEDSDDEKNDPLAMIRSMFRYDRNKYKDDDDVSDMEANFDEIEMEERRSRLIGQKEDEEEARLLEEEEERRRKRLLKKRKMSH